MIPPRTLVAKLPWLLLLPSAVLAQEPAPQRPDPAPIFPVAAQLVWIDAVAVDSEDRPVATLEPEDFEIRERGARRPIILFRPPDLETAGRALVFLIEDALARDWHIERARDLIERAISRAVPGDRILLVAKASRVATSAPLPGAAKALAAALGRIRAHSEVATTAREPGQVRQLNASRIDAVVAALEALRGHPGPRAVVVLGPPCPYRADGPFGRAAYERVMRASQHAAAPLYFLEWPDQTGLLETPSLGPGPEPGEQPLAGVTPVAPMASLAAGETGTLVYDKIAEDSGGFSTRATTTWSWSLDRVYQRARAAYLLGIPAEPENCDGRYHPLDVRVTRGGVRLRARKGYFAPKPEGREN